jgi:hypothetical protein
LLGRTDAKVGYPDKGPTSDDGCFAVCLRKRNNVQILCLLHVDAQQGKSTGEREQASLEADE